MYKSDSLQFIDNATSPSRLKIYDRGYILFKNGVFSLCSQYEDEFIAESASFLGKWDYSMKSAFVAYSQILSVESNVGLVLSNFRSKENLKFLQLVAEADTRKAFQNPVRITDNYYAFNMTRRFFVGFSIMASLENLTISIDGMGTYRFSCDTLNDKLFAVYFMLHLNGCYLSNDCIVQPKKQMQYPCIDIKSHKDLFYYLKGEND